jgi:ABC-type uncharacterized transport system substrate-binding protein
MVAGMIWRWARPCLVAIVLAASGPAPASAHPHVFVSVKSQVVFNADGKVAAIRHVWTFDEMYSSFATAGLNGAGKGPNAEQLAAIAKQNIEDLAQYEWFTHGRGGSQRIAFTTPTEFTAVQPPGGNLELHFTLPLTTPASAGKAFTFEVYDPSYFVAFSFDDKSPPTLENAPKGCSISLFKPKPLDAGLQAKLNESFFSGLSPGADFGVQLAERVIVACP